MLTHHTELTDDRSASFLHLRLAPTSSTRSHTDLLVSDLPGEWTTDLVSQGRVDRFAFLHRADVIWLVVDGDKLRKPQDRHLVRHRLRLAAERAAAFLSGNKPPLLLVVTRRDHGSLEDVDLAELRAIGEQAGFVADVVEVACFAHGDSDVKPGYGLAPLVARTVDCAPGMQVEPPEALSDATFQLPRIGLTRSY